VKLTILDTYNVTRIQIETEIFNALLKEAQEIKCDKFDFAVSKIGYESYLLNATNSDVLDFLENKYPRIFDLTKSDSIEMIEVNLS
jgi:hypothetical protein